LLKAVTNCKKECTRAPAVILGLLREGERMLERQMPTQSELLTEWLSTLADVSDRLQGILDRFNARERELHRLGRALARIETPGELKEAGQDHVAEYVSEEHRRRAA
jgi:hypothetical protein